MASPDAVSDYVETVREALSFDRVLAARVCDEVRDHFEDALRAGDPAEHTADAAFQLIQRFGDARVFAAAFAPVAVRRIGLRTAGLLVAVLTGVLAIMEVRTGLLLQWAGVSGPQDGWSATAFAVDKAAFVLALAAAVAYAAWLGLRRGPPATADFALPAAAALPFPAQVAGASLIASVLADGLAFFGLMLGSHWNRAAWITSFALLGEFALAGLLVWWFSSAFRTLRHLTTMVGCRQQESNP